MSTARLSSLIYAALLQFGSGPPRRSNYILPNPAPPRIWRGEDEAYGSEPSKEGDCGPIRKGEHWLSFVYWASCSQFTLAGSDVVNIGVIMPLTARWLSLAWIPPGARCRQLINDEAASR